MTNTPLLRVVLDLGEDNMLHMSHVAQDPTFIEHLGERGAAIAAYVCRELVANAVEHGQAKDPGGLELADSSRVRISMPGASFDSVGYKSDSGGLANCRKLLKNAAIAWSHRRLEARNQTTLTFTTKVDYEVLK